MHLLLYDVGENEAGRALLDRLDSIRTDRLGRIQEICARLRALSIEIPEAPLLAAAHGRTPGRPDVARALVAAGVVSSIPEAFSRFLHDGGPADVPIARLGVDEGIELGRRTGAKIALAHPHTLRSYALVRDLFVRFYAEGLEGLEVYYGTYAHAERRGWERLCGELRLVATGGSDFHGGGVNPAVARVGIDMPEGPARDLVQWLGLS